MSQIHSQALQVRTKKVSAKTFAQEKAWQHSLSGTERFENVRRIRAEDRLRLHMAGQRARKTRERALRDVEFAASCLVDVVPKSSSYILFDSSEAPIDYVDLTRQGACRPSVVEKEQKLASEPWPPRNWKGENMGLITGDAYILVTDCEQSDARKALIVK